jgi:DNA polymerase (family 10)
VPDLTNAEVAATLDRYGTLLELSGESPFRVRAYRRAADSIRYLPDPIADLHRAGQLRAVPGVGEGIAAAVGELLELGTYRPLVEIEQRIPATLLELLAIPGVGIKTATRLYREFGIVDLAGLEAAAVAGRLHGMRGAGGRLETTILAGLESLKRRTGRTLLAVALPVGRDLVSAIAGILPSARVSLAGSVRRMEDTVGDIDVVVGDDDPGEALAAIGDLPLIASTLGRSDGAARFRLQSGLESDVFAVARSHFGPTLIRATGSGAHLAMLGDSLAEVPTESEVYAARGLPWIPPELRQGLDELKRSAEIDRLVTAQDINGEFHAHTVWSDGAGTVADMAAAAVGRGYRFLGITDHSKGLGVANGLDEARLAAQRKEIAAASAQVGIRLFAGTEVEVARDGRLDFDDQELGRLDVVVASLHSGLRQPRPELTDRLLRVLANPNVDVIAHPRGRLIERRDGGDFDWDRVFATAARTGTALEINSDPSRLDLSSELARQALTVGCLLTINCDAHHPAGFENIEYGVAVARRAWARAEQILNCWSVERVETWLAERSRAST